MTTTLPPEASVTLRYWAAARAATGVAAESRPPGPISDLLAAATLEHPDLDRVLTVATILVDGLAVDRDGWALAAPAGAVVEVLPPFAGG